MILFEEHQPNLWRIIQYDRGRIVNIWECEYRGEGMTRFRLYLCSIVIWHIDPLDPDWDRLVLGLR